MKSPADGKTGEVKALFLYNDLLFGGDDKGNVRCSTIKEI